MKWIKPLIAPTLALLIIGVVVTAALSVTNFFTKDRIAQAEQQKIAQAMEQLFPQATFTLVDEQEQSGFTLYAVQQNEQHVGYIAQTSAMGYKSEVTVLTALDLAVHVQGIAVTDCADESPGIGQKIGTDQAFLSQYQGYSPDQTVDAITGATYSSDAVTQAVNSAIDYLQEFLRTPQEGGEQP